ncbi:MAG: protein phosphatase [Candidatus Kuenenia sp.]|nr:protein phosphatase [Candidatus Kuenenia hertensis]
MNIPRNFSWLIKDEIAGMARPISVVSDFEFLKENGIDVIVSLSEWPLHKTLLDEFGFVNKHIPIADLTPPTQEQIEEFISFVNEAVYSRRRVVVHCDAGIGRTGTMLACYLINKGFSAKDAIAEVRKKRPGSIETIEQEETIFEYEERFSRKK